MGNLPQIFDGNRSKADGFIEEVKGYLRLNRDVAGYNSPIKKVAFTLTLVKGENVQGWVRDMGTWLDTLDAADNVPAVWTQFLAEFDTQFMDSQRADKARIKLNAHKMTYPDIDQYISGFEELARQAGYTQGNEETTNIFLRGLNKSVLEDVLKPPFAVGYNDIKERAIQVTRSKQIIDSIVGKRFLPGGQSTTYQRFTGQQNLPRRPFFSQNNRGGGSGQGQWRSNQTTYNSSNAPPSMANTPVAMDLSADRSRSYTQRRGRGFNRGGYRGNYRGNQNRYRGNAAQIEEQEETNALQSEKPRCYQCGSENHFACSCPQRRTNTSMNLIDFDENLYQKDEPKDRIAQLKHELSHLNNDDRERLANEMGVNEDFPTA
jgi:hypothetical protein